MYQYAVLPHVIPNDTAHLKANRRNQKKNCLQLELIFFFIVELVVHSNGSNFE